jgi:hypothetical protein
MYSKNEEGKEEEERKGKRKVYLFIVEIERVINVCIYILTYNLAELMFIYRHGYAIYSPPPDVHVRGFRPGKIGVTNPRAVMDFKENLFLFIVVDLSIFRCSLLTPK